MNVVSAIYFGNRRRTQTVHAQWLCISFLTVFCALSLGANAECSLQSNASSPVHELELLKLLKPLEGHVFSVIEGDYNYTLGICTDVGDEKSMQNAGIVQREIKGEKKNFSLGRYDEVDIMGGTDWILLTYYGGTPYTTHCDLANRTSYIMVICDPNTVLGSFRRLEERKKGTDNCFYLFEVGSSVSCNSVWRKEDPHLSSGSVFCIIFFTVAGIYLLLGFLYQRVVIGAKGLEQVPNYAFWRSFGNLQADGCDYTCRCGPRQESQAYRGIDDRIRTDEERDDQLLNM